MKVLKTLKTNRLFTPALAVLVLAVAALLGVSSVSYAVEVPTAPYTLDVGYLGFTYGELVDPATDVIQDHTASRPQSKLWWHDGYWWATMWNEGLDEYHIYRLNWGTQDWQDTGVALDERPEARTDVLMDSSTGKLYIASHFKQNNPSSVNGIENWARLYRFTYDEVTDSFVPDGGSPFYGANGINQDKTNSVVIDKDDGGRLWATYVSRDPQVTPPEYQVYFNYSDDDGETWEGPFSLPDIGFNEAFVEVDDLSSVIAYDGNLALVWTNQADTNLYFAERVSGMPVNSTDGWDVQAITIPEGIDDHINVKANSAGQIFIAVKTKGDDNGGGPLVGMVTRDTDGTTAFHEYSATEYNDTRPIMVVDEANDQVHIFVTGKPDGSKICYKTAEITSDLSDMSFPPGDCGDAFIDDDDFVYDGFDSATTSKHNMTAITGLVVLAHDDHNGRVYGHNVMGDPPPVVTNRSPGVGETEVALGAVISVQFSKNMNVSTVVDTNNFIVEDGGGAIPGSIDYDGATRTATFTPSVPLIPNTTYSVEITTGMQDEGGQALYEAETWTFETGEAATVPSVAFSVAAYDVNEDAGTATITVNLSEASVQTVQVIYATASGTATSGSDYTPVGGTLTFDIGETTQTFDVPIADDAIYEPDETVNLVLSNPQNATLGTPSEAVLTIVDNEPQPTVQFSMAEYTVNEAAGTALITVELSGQSALTAAVDYATGGGTATPGSDYVATSGTLEFAAGETSKTFTVNILNDTFAEADETVILTLSNPDDVTLGTPNPATLTIVDDGDVEEEEIMIYLPAIFRQ